MVVAIGVTLLALVFVAAAESLSRLLLERSPAALTVGRELVFDPVVGWRGRRGFEGLVPHGKYPVPIAVSINADGFRDESWDVKLERAARTGARKVLVLGDSLVYGWASPADGRLTEQLQALSTQRGRPMEAFNAAMPAYGPAHQTRLLPELLARIRPDDVVVVFCVNDYGDTALPYDYRYPMRIYQPFYDTTGQLRFNAEVPRRPSVAMRDGPLGGLRLWRALDLVDALVRDRGYARHGVITPQTPGVAIHQLGDFFYDEALQRRFPYVEATVLALYGRMAELARAGGARFAFLPSIERVPPRWVTFDSVMRDRIESRGIPYLSPPTELTTYAPWIGTWRDGHPNFVWGWVLAARLFADLAGRSFDARLVGLPQVEALGISADLRDGPALARSLSLEWGETAGDGRRLEGPGAVMLRHPDPGRGVAVRITARADQDATLAVSIPAGRAACRMALGPAARTETCALPGPPEGELVLVLLEPSGPTGVEVSRVEVVPGTRAP